MAAVVIRSGPFLIPISFAGTGDDGGASSTWGGGGGYGREAWRLRGPASRGGGTAPAGAKAHAHRNRAGTLTEAVAFERTNDVPDVA